MKIKTQHTITIFVVCLIALSLSSVFFGARISEPESVRQARAAAQVRQTRLDAAALVPIWTGTKILALLAVAFLLLGIASAGVAYAWKQVFTTHARDGLYPLMGTHDPNRSIHPDATMAQVGVAMAALQVQSRAAALGNARAFELEQKPQARMPLVAGRMPAVRVVRDDDQIARMEQILAREGL